MTTHELLLAAKAAAPALAWLGSEEKNAAILRMADAIVRETDVILAANEADVQAAKGTISDVMLDRLRLTQARIAAMADGMRQVSALPDPVGEVLAEVRRPNGLVIRKTAVPLGVVAIIYESRPNVTSDAAVLAMKSGNVCVLRGGKEAYRSAAAIVAAMHEGLREAGLPETFVNLVSDPTRRSAQELMTASGLVDLLIPRGGAGLIRACVESATVPCIETGTGICHVYVDKDADLEKALNIIENAKTSRPSVCNADEVALVIILRADLLGGGEHGVGLVVAAADADGHVVGRRLDAQDRTGEDLMLLRRERVEDHAALGLADALDDDLLGRLGRDAAEGLRLHVDVDQIAQLRGLADLAGRVERDLGGGGDDVVDDFLLHVHVHIVVLDLDKDVIGIAVLVLLVCGDERLRDLLDHVALRDPAFFFQLRKRRKNFGIHVFEIPPFKTRREAAPARPRFSGMYVWPLRPRSSPRRLRSR